MRGSSVERETFKPRAKKAGKGEELYSIGQGHNMAEA
jgi:hypothetical protein